MKTQRGTQEDSQEEFLSVHKQMLGEIRTLNEESCTLNRVCVTLCSNEASVVCLSVRPSGVHILPFLQFLMDFDSDAFAGWN